MLELLEQFNYRPPVIIPGRYGNMEIKVDGGYYYYMTVDGNQWMAYNTQTHEEAYHVFSHYDLADGHVVVTGLGLGAREAWILTKPNVSRLTIIEKNLSVINYHYEIKSRWLQDPRVEIICQNAVDLNMKCDTLLLDHYELEDFGWILDNAKRIHDRVDCKTFWLYPLERIIMHCRQWHSDNDPPFVLLTKHDALDIIKRNYGLSKIPEIPEQKLNMYCMMHHSTLFSKSEYVLSKAFPDRKVFKEIYRII